MYHVIHYLYVFQFLQYDNTENVGCVKDVVHPCLWQIILWEKSYRLSYVHRPKFLKSKD